jgi:signal transduction histidine kinase
MSTSQCLVLVDDNLSDLQLIKHTITQAFPDADVRALFSAPEALAFCRNDRVDCVLADYNMPEMDGIAFAEALSHSAPHTPMVLMTAIGDEMLAARALRGGAYDYIPKSRITRDSIRRTISRAVRLAEQDRVIAEQREELENFAYALAHDFKQPIRQIRTFSDMIAEELGEDGRDQVRKHLEFLATASRRLGDLVDVMSQYTLLSKPPEISEIDLGWVMQEVGETLDTYVAERDGELVVSDMPVVAGNAALLMQVLSNLIINGLKYNESTPPRVAVSARVENGACHVEVRDNGLGIEEQFLTEIFKPLTRLHTAAEYAGTGLGLTLARKAVIAQGGALWCESELGSGSTFFVRLPLPGGQLEDEGADAA